MPGNNDPIYSKRGAITRSALLKTAATSDYSGVNEYNKEVFAADPTNGSYIQRLRFKAMGTNVATVARIYLNDGDQAANFGAAIGAPTGTPSASGGTVWAGTYYAMIIAVDAKGRLTPIGTISAGVVVTGTTGSIAWSWTAPSNVNVVSYRVYIGITNSVEALTRYFSTATNSYSQTTMHSEGTYDDPQVGNSKLYGEVSLPATTAIATAATSDIDYPMNIALPPGWEVYVGLATGVAAGWLVMGIGGDY
jgi:hypothetical protein